LWILKQLKSKEVNLSYLGKVFIKYIKLLIIILVKLTIIGNDEVERVHIHKLKEYHSKSVVADIMVANVYVKRCFSRWAQMK
jgi:hypothetical protein